MRESPEALDGIKASYDDLEAGKRHLEAVRLMRAEDDDLRAKLAQLIEKVQVAVHELYHRAAGLEPLFTLDEREIID